MNNLHDFAEFMKRREQAAGAYVSGDASPLLGLASQSDPATFFGPSGGHVSGSDAVRSSHEQGAKMFAPGAENRFEILHMAQSGDLAYWVGFQRATTHMKDGSTVPFDLRITELYRREEGEWKLIHRHADTLVAGR